MLKSLLPIQRLFVSKNKAKPGGLILEIKRVSLELVQTGDEVVLAVLDGRFEGALLAHPETVLLEFYENLGHSGGYAWGATFCAA